MKHLSTVTSIVIAVVMLLAAFGIGLGIREIRTWRAEVESGEQTIPASSTPERGTRPSGELSQEQRAELKERRAETLERMANMSEAEQEQFRSQMRAGFDPRRRGGRGGGPGASPEERARMRERFENMTEEEREQFRAQMRERFGGRRRPRGEGEPGPAPQDRAESDNLEPNEGESQSESPVVAPLPPSTDDTSGGQEGQDRPDGEPER